MTEEALFDLILRTPQAERAALLDRACQGQPDLRRRVEALLAADAASANVLDAAATASLAGSPIQTTIGDEPGTILGGRYKLLERIGEGGMGTVWMARQDEPVKRLVAVKLVKSGSDSQAVLARFEAERQALAVMDHPNIAKVLDGGLTNDSRPFFVMELVKGVA